MVWVRASADAQLEGQQRLFRAEVQADETESLWRAWADQCGLDAEPERVVQEPDEDPMWVAIRGWYA